MQQNVTVESRCRVYRHSFYHSCKFLVGLKNFQIKMLEYTELRLYLRINGIHGKMLDKGVN